MVLETNLSTVLATITEEFVLTQGHLCSLKSLYQNHSDNVSFSLHLCNLRVS